MTQHNRKTDRPRSHPLRRVAISLLSMLLLCALIPATATRAGALDWMTPYLDRAVEWGIIRDDLVNQPNPNETVTRGEFVAMVNRAYGYKDVGPTPFTDVDEEAWYYDDIGIAYHIGYFRGTSGTTASPDDNLTREQAAVILARNMMLEERSGEALGFSDSRELSSWSRGLVQPLYETGVITGHDDNSFRPKDSITRIQVAAMLVRAVGTPIQEEGTYSDRNYSGNVTITSSNVKLKDAIITGDLYISGGVDLGGVELENVTVLGRIIVSGGGESERGKRSVILRNVIAEELLVDSITNQFVTVQAEGLTNIPEVNVRTHAYLEDLTEDGLGLRFINLDGEPGSTFQLAGNIKEAVNLTPASTLNIAQGIAHQVTIDEDAIGSTLNIDGSAEVGSLNLDVATEVTGTGDISHLEVNAPGSTVAMLPDTITIRPGITADIAGDTMDTAGAIESSEDPRLLAGYPAARNVAPTAADAVFSTNKRGTVYWALSALTDGSVSEEDLINPPAYGGNIIQRGTLDVASSKTEHTVSLSRLTKDGSYYISAILVDNRGFRSPVKVTAFTTPDDTVPAFINENTYVLLADINNEQIAQAMVMANKTCKLYYVLLPKGSVAPTAADFKAQSLSGSLGHGVMDIYKNESLLIPRINTIPLEEQTQYDLYLWLTDADGAKSSTVKKLSVTTKDRTPPVLQQLLVTDIAARTVSLTFALDEPGTLYWGIVNQGADFFTKDNQDLIQADANALLPKLQIETGLGSLKNGSSRASKAMTAVNFTISGLDPETSYDMYYVIKDSAGNYGVYSGSFDTGLRSGTYDMPLTINTLDNQPPTVEQEFTHDGTSDPNNLTPYPDTSIRLVFSEHVQGIKDKDNDGSPDNDNLLELYENNKDSASGREHMANILRQYIKLYQVGSTDPVPDRSQNPTLTDDQWVIDYRYVTVAPDPDGTGKLILTFPYNANLSESALNLSGGVTYYFTLEDIGDTADPTSNRMAGLYGITTLQEFTTISAQIALASSYTDPVQIGNSTIEFDMSFTATPLSHDSMADTVRWDLAFWSSSTVSFDLYEKTAAGWARVGNQSITITSNEGDLLGASSGRVLRNNGFEVLQDMEDEGREFGIKVTAINGDPDPSNWNTPVTLRVTALAGTRNALVEAANKIANSFSLDQILDAAVTDITTPANFTITHTFIDNTPPTFVDYYPMFEPYDEGVLIDVMLSRPSSRYYYVVAELGAMTTNYPINGVGTSINTSNVTSGWALLPQSGDDLYRYNPDGTPALDNDGNHIYDPTFASLPTSNTIMTATSSARSVAGRDTFNGVAKTIEIDGLKPSTKYIAYFVLQGEAQDSYSQVYCFQFETEETTRPIITLVNNNSFVSTSVDRDATLSYFLAVQGEEGILFNQDFSKYLSATATTAANWNLAWDDAGYSVLEAMNDTVKDADGNSTGSVFDHFASEDAKYTFGNLIRNQQAGASNIVLINEEHFNKGVAKDITSDQMEDGVYHTLVVVAKSDLGSGDAFAAIWPVYKRDNEAPYVVGTITTESGQRMLEGYGNIGTGGGIRQFSGELTITFNEPLYNMVTTGGSQTAQLLDGCLLSGGTNTHAVNSQFGRLAALYTLQPTTTAITQVEGRHGTATTSVTFKFTNARVGASIRFQNTICDANRNRHTQELVVRLAEIELDDNGNPTGTVYFSVTEQWLSPGT